MVLSLPSTEDFPAQNHVMPSEIVLNVTRLSVIVLSVVILAVTLLGVLCQMTLHCVSFVTVFQCHYTVYIFAGWHYVMCHHAQCRYGVYYYSVIMLNVIITSAITLYCYAE